MMNNGTVVIHKKTGVIGIVDTNVEIYRYNQKIRRLKDGEEKPPKPAEQIILRVDPITLWPSTDKDDKFEYNYNEWFKVANTHTLQRFFDAMKAIDDAEFHMNSCELCEADEHYLVDRREVYLKLKKIFDR